ncbi:MAG TPA: hypothetical protein ENJ98_02810 [Thiolapillus brandeum]|uniref:Uncharacterized protein n=1 Tax=Thiolapillus brandeum TaxID=1076588 RepID=A0A7C5N3M7_9GAMM|nr:hypothetical protein [Thiolapillus brandeum]
MPYFIFEITTNPESGVRIARYLDTCEKYRDAKQKVKAEREANPETEHRVVRMAFAKSQVEAEKLLTTPREGQPIINED